MESQSQKSSPPSEGGKPRSRPSTSTMWLIFALLFVGGYMLLKREVVERSRIDYSFFHQQLVDDNILEVDFQDEHAAFGKFKEPPLAPEVSEDEKGRKESEAKEPKRLAKDFVTTLSPLVGENLQKLLDEKGVDVKAQSPSDYTGAFMMVWLLVTVLLIVGVWSVFRRTRDQVMGGGLFSGLTKSPARRYEADKTPVTFEDVAGLDGVKRDLEEIVEYLKNPEKFHRLGGRVPKGVLLMGSPGTGKTLLARAVAGEAGTPFFSISGSEFIQMFVGVGAGRVRDLFKTAKENSPAIMFIDEIDAVGRQRGAGLGGGHDEREQTLNQILSEMDGFSQHESVIVLAATNRPDVLDPALLRPGRFDRHITVDRPTLKGRKAIFDVHVQGVPLADDVDLDRLASGTVGLTGADIRNLVNEAALWATRQGKDQVEMSDMEFARDKVLMGPKREELLTDQEKTITAYHEAGHALLAWIVPGADRVHKVTIIPRGQALGVTQLLPQEDRMNIGEGDLYARLVFMLGGRAAEKLVFDEFSAGAEDDLKKVTRLARRMVAHWGMSERLGPVAYRTSEDHPFLGREIIQEHREFSEHTAQMIDEEVARVLHEAAGRARDLLTQNREKLEQLAHALEEREVIVDSEIEILIGPSVNEWATSNGKPEDQDLPENGAADSSREGT